MFRSDLLSGKKGIITGGSSGIGFFIAKTLIGLGANVTITGRDQEKINRAVAELGSQAFGVRGDVRVAKEVEATIDSHRSRFERIDFLINNAAGNFLCSLENLSENGFRAVNDIVALGTFLYSKGVLPAMKAQGEGRIINIGTTYAFGQGSFVGHSGAAKAAVLNLTKTMAVEWAPYGILANMIAPGPVEGTEGVRRLMAGFQEAFEPYIPLKRMATGDEIGALVAFLLSPLASYITGAVIPIDGGMHLLNPGLIPAPLFGQIQAVLKG